MASLNKLKVVWSGGRVLKEFRVVERSLRGQQVKTGKAS